MVFNSVKPTVNGDVKDYVSDLDERVKTEFTAVNTSVVGLQNAVGSKFKYVDGGYGTGAVFNKSLSGQIFLVVTGRWNSLTLVTYDRGTETYLKSEILSHNRVTLTPTATGLTIVLDANAEWVIYKLA